jgi:hypothetical protein
LVHARKHGIDWSLIYEMKRMCKNDFLSTRSTMFFSQFKTATPEKLRLIVKRATLPASVFGYGCAKAMTFLTIILGLGSAFFGAVCGSGGCDTAGTGAV